MASPPKRRAFPVPRSASASRGRSATADAHGSLWAISYSDLLMVLLAFFILYFKFGEQTSATILSKVTNDLRLSGNLQKEGSPEPTLGKAPSTTAAASTLKGGGAKSLQSNLKASGFTVEQPVDEQNVLVHFPDGYYGSGKYQLSGPQQEVLKHFLQVVEPYKNGIDLIFIGHTDDSAVRKTKGIIDSNLVLSNLRAARAAEFALLNGFEPSQVSSQGVGPYRRGSRSLSVRILQRGSK